MAWDAHESCWAKRPGRKVGSAAIAAPRVERTLLEDENGGDGDPDGELDEEQHVRASGEIQAKNY